MVKKADSILLSRLVKNFINSIQAKQPIELRIDSINDLEQLLPILTAHSLEHLAFVSCPSFRKSMVDFYRKTYALQKQVIRRNIIDAIRNYKVVFLQGFPRNSDFCPVMPTSLRHDIDLYVPKNNIDDFTTSLLNSGFRYIGLDESNLFDLDKTTMRLFREQFWSKKGNALSYVQETDLLKNLPIKIDKNYPPYFQRGDKCYLFTSIEPHYSYIDDYDIGIIENDRQYWPALDCDRLDETTTLYFNLVRLYKGIEAGEHRLRIVLETACLVADIVECTIDFDKLAEIIDNSSISSPLHAVSSVLAKKYPLFAPLARTPCESELTRWLEEKYNEMLNIT